MTGYPLLPPARADLEAHGRTIGPSHATLVDQAEMTCLHMNEKTESETQPSYEQLTSDLHALLGGEKDLIANTANCAALLFHSLLDLNWVGFYFLRGRELVLGPFQGKPACIRIGLGRGVCGTAAATRQSQVVRDVREFPGHIACDPRSRSEIVVPLLWRGDVLGVLDVDSASVGRFAESDRVGLEAIARVLLDQTDTEGRPWPR